MVLNRLRDLFFGSNDDNDGLLDAPAPADERSLGEVHIGDLKIPTRILGICTADGPHGSLEIPNLASEKVSFFSVNSRQPDGRIYQSGLIVRACGMMGSESPFDDEQTEELGAGGYKIVLADMQDLHDHWTEVGLKRVGRINTARGHKLRKQIERKFGLKTRFDNVVAHEIVGDVSRDLEEEILEFVRSVTIHKDFPQMVFSVETWNSFDRINRMESNWEVMPIGNEKEPLMLVYEAIDGMGYRTVTKHLRDQKVEKITFDFMVPCVD